MSTQGPISTPLRLLLSLQKPRFTARASCVKVRSYNPSLQGSNLFDGTTQVPIIAACCLVLYTVASRRPQMFEHLRLFWVCFRLREKRVSTGGNGNSTEKKSSHAFPRPSITPYVVCRNLMMNIYLLFTATVHCTMLATWRD